ncbi:MAG: hypothetical protein WC054_00695 [Candidatus Nanopelagicales bacterium]
MERVIAVPEPVRVTNDLSALMYRVVEEMRRLHVVKGAVCPTCPGTEVEKQEECIHRDRQCRECGSRWPCTSVRLLRVIPGVS